jgi:hypothetical protein
VIFGARYLEELRRFDGGRAYIMIMRCAFSHLPDTAVYANVAVRMCYGFIGSAVNANVLIEEAIFRKRKD